MFLVSKRPGIEGVSVGNGRRKNGDAEVPDKLLHHAL